MMCMGPLWLGLALYRCRDWIASAYFSPPAAGLTATTRSVRPVNHKNPKERAQAVGRATGGSFMVDGPERPNPFVPPRKDSDFPGRCLPGEGTSSNSLRNEKEKRPPSYFEDRSPAHGKIRYRNAKLGHPDAQLACLSAVIGASFISGRRFRMAGFDRLDKVPPE